MRYINNSNIRIKRWQIIADQHRKCLFGFTLSAERKAYIDNTPADRKWNIVKPNLERLGHMKCWYTEAREAVSPLYIEHFRPKKQINLIQNIDPYPECRTSQDTEGYWWLSYELSNFRIAANYPNKKKGTYFPLENGSRIASTIHSNIKCERPMLLDPCVKEDIKLLSYRGPIPEPTDSNPANLDNNRARISITIYDLSNNRLKIDRSILFGKCKKQFERADYNWNEMNNNRGSNPDAFTIAAENFAEICVDLIEYLNPKSVYTRMIFCYYDSQTNPWVNEYILDQARLLKYIN